MPPYHFESIIELQGSCKRVLGVNTAIADESMYLVSTVRKQVK
ncbi:hypothetical protein SPB21_24565 [Leptothoe sp. ISB3NOV94-8A]